MSTNLVLYRKSGKAFAAPIVVGCHVGNTVDIGTWEADWSHIVSFRLGEAPYLLFYRYSGAAFTAPVVSGTEVGPTAHIGDWAADWAQPGSQLASFEFADSAYLLLYRRSDGYAFTARVLSPTSLGQVTGIGHWEQDWAQIVPFRFNGAPYLLLYRDNGEAFTAPIHAGDQIGQTRRIGGWESDWAHIVFCRAEGVPYFLLYRKNGTTFVAQILSDAHIGTPAQIGRWEDDWGQILEFDIRTTENFAYAYDPILGEAEVINGEKMLVALAQTCEADFSRLQGLFRTAGGFGRGNRVLVWMTNQVLTEKGGVNFGYIQTDRKSQVSVSAKITAPDVARCVFVAEMAEIFMSYQGQFYKGKWKANNSMGEALSLLLADLLYPSSGWVGDRVTAWLNDKSKHVVSPSGSFYSRPDWITVTEASDKNQVSYGCALLFLYWLQTRYSLEDIIAASGATCVELYSNLSGRHDGWAQFHDAVAKLYPETDNPSFVWKKNNIFI